MLRVLTIIFLLFTCLAPKAQALFLLDDDLYGRPGRNVVSAAHIADGTAVNISWGIWPNANLYLVFATGAGLGWKQRLLAESEHLPFSWDISLENTSLRNWHTSAYGTSLWKALGAHSSFFLKYERVENTTLWPGLSELKNTGIYSAGFTIGLSQNSKILVQAGGGPAPFGCLGYNILL